MNLVAQKQPAKGYEARDMQYGGRREAVQLEAIELQEPPEKWMNWKSESSYQIRDKPYPVSHYRWRARLEQGPCTLGGEIRGSEASLVGCAGRNISPNLRA